MITDLILAVFLGIFAGMITFYRGRHFKHQIGRQQQMAKPANVPQRDFDLMMDARRYLNIYSLFHLIGMLFMFGFWISVWLFALDDHGLTAFYTFIIILPIVFILLVVKNLLWMDARHTETMKLRWSAVVNTIAFLAAAAFSFVNFVPSIHTHQNFPALRWVFLVWGIIFSVWWILEMIYMWWGTGYERGIPNRFRRSYGNQVVPGPAAARAGSY